MSQKTAQIVRDEDLMGGEPVIEGTRIAVLRVHALVHERDLPPEEVAAMHDLAEEDVTAALDYYEGNPQIIEEVLEWREEMERRSCEAGAKTIDEVRREREGESDGVSDTR